MSRLFRVRNLVFLLLAAVPIVVAVGFWRARHQSAGRVDSARAARGPDLRAALPAWAQDPGAERGSIAGVVQGPDGKPIAAAQIALLPEVGLAGGDPRLRPAARVSSGSDGRFRIAGVIPGEYGLTASAAGYSGAHRSGLAVLPGGQLEGIELQLEAGGIQLSGTVSDAGGGTIAGAEVRAAAASRGGSGTRIFLTAADAGGRYRLTLPKESHLVVADADGYAPESRLLDTSLSSTADFALRPAARLAGKVVGKQDGAPVPGAVVLLDNPQVWWRPTQDATTDARGAFEFRDLEGGVFRLSAQKGAQVASPREVELSEADRATEVTIELETGRAITGRALAEGKPVSGARIRLRQGMISVPGRVRAESGADGSYRVDGVLPGRYQVVGEAKGHAPAALDVSVTADRDREGADLLLAPETVVKGTVTGPGGQPATGATVMATVIDAGSGSMFGRQGIERTDREGRFRLGGLVAGKVTLVASETGVGRVTWGPEPVAAGETREVALALLPGATVSGLVKYDDGQPAPGVTVVGITAASMSMAQARTDAQGKFELGPLAAGQTMVKASRKEGLAGMLDMGDMERAQKQITLSGNEAHKGVELVITRGGRSLSGLVVDPDGKPVAGASVGADRNDMGMGMRAALGAMLGDKGVRTGEDGRFTLADLEKGPYTVWAKHTRYPDAKVEKVPDGAKEVRLQFPREAVLAGTVTDPAGKPVTDFSVMAVEAEGKDTSDPRSGLRKAQNFARLMGGSSAVHDAGGAFELRGLAAGTYDVVVTTGEGKGGQLPGLAVAAGERKAGLRVTIQRGITLRGKVATFAEGQAVPGIPIVLMGDQMSMKSADAKGAFSFDGLIPGRKVVLGFGGQMSGFAQDMMEIDLPANQSEMDVGTLKLVRNRDRPEPAGPGVGFSYRFENRQPLVKHVFAKGPAVEGVRVGDRIVAIDGKTVDGLGNAGLGTLLAGETGSSVEVTVATADQPPRPVKITRK
jgi:hypothetical protein